jgi:hypothetical protein
MSESTVKLIGLIRDALMAIGGALILFHVNLSQEQIAGVIGIVAPLVALGSYIYSNVSSPKGHL